MVKDNPVKLPNCVNCKFYEVDPANLDAGVCRKRAPIAIPIPVGPQSVQVKSTFPPTKAVNWCGDHKWKVEPEEN